MKKKRYIKPALKVFELGSTRDLICTSTGLKYNRDQPFDDESQIG